MKAIEKIKSLMPEQEEDNYVPGQLTEALNRAEAQPLQPSRPGPDPKAVSRQNKLVREANNRGLAVTPVMPWVNNCEGLHVNEMADRIERAMEELNLLFNWDLMQNDGLAFQRAYDVGMESAARYRTYFSPIEATAPFAEVDDEQATADDGEEADAE